MTLLVITDLTESVELDRQAMAAIVGGARIGTHYVAQQVSGALRVVDYPPGFPAARQAPPAQSATAPRIAASPSLRHK
ncbi:hypothetical protein [Paraburkholderia gardini]|uniref:Uncharacterized protein n=1 Tax=Paraburkholderia gardini TaxID=2823469 RepID=A0ABN7QU63_9BURK|nr:hypothetical protein [Paraburkholderia gardini]CAG4923381.1 hypothetical protein R54767_04990 [Paraburkholderia gardini]